MAQEGLVRRGDEIWHYAECNTGAHGAGERFQVRAIQRLDGFTSLSASEAGIAVTRPLIIDGDRLMVNADVRGEIRVEIRDPDGQPIAGFEANASVPLTGDSVRHEVRWGSGAAFGSLAGRPLRIAFVLKDADLYAFATSKEN